MNTTADQIENDMLEGNLLWRGYTRQELQEAFDLVANPRDWKAPIDATVDEHKRGVVCAAIEFYTATTARATIHMDAHGRILTRVQAAGYRLGPAGDH